MLWEQGVVGSNPATPTKGRISLEIRPFFFKQGFFFLSENVWICLVHKSSKTTSQKRIIMGKKKIIVLPHLVDAGGDLTKDWFVEYSDQRIFQVGNPIIYQAYCVASLNMKNLISPRL